MKKKCDIVLSLLFAGFLFAGPAALFLVQDREFSENENRYLAGKPELSADGVISGNFMKDVENYINDQFVFRDRLIGMKTEAQLLLGRTEINGVYIGREGYLIERWQEQEVDRELMEQNVDDLNSFAERHRDLKISTLIAPTSGLIMKSKLPAYATEFDQKKALALIGAGLDERIHFIDVTDQLLNHADEYIYYKTDHHWTSLGAFYAFQRWCGEQGQTAAASDYAVTTVTDSFRGTLYSKVLASHAAFDSISMFEDKGQPGSKVFYNFGKTESDSIYDMKRLDEKDKYQFFLGGNHPELSIRTGNQNGKHLLVIKDSYANAFIPFLVRDYETVHVIDPRYFNRDIDQYMEEHEVTEVLILYNVKSFSEDRNIYRLNQIEGKK